MQGVYSYVESAPRDSLVLFEISSALFYREGPRAVYHTARWALWNMAMACELRQVCEASGVELLVSPSSGWTLGHGLAARHQIASCQQPEKNLREAEAMLYFHEHNPEPWVPMGTYLGAL